MFRNSKASVHGGSPALIAGYARRPSVQGVIVFKPLVSALALAVLALVSQPAASAEDARWAYGANGWEWREPGTGSYLWLGLRFQTRYSNRMDDPLIPDDLRTEGDDGFSLNRARYKIGAGLGRHLTFYHEYDLVNGELLDLRATWKPSSYFQLRAGQWKTDYNRERIDSSGKQQFVERSIANYWFTVDRQSGLMANGRYAAGTAADSSWWLGVLQGSGINSSGDGGRPMFVGRYQWNFTRNVLPFSQSAVKQYDAAHGSLAAGFVSNDSAYTRYSSAGGGQLPGYEDGEDNQYRLEQWMLEFAWQWQGWSLQGEAHHKDIHDRFNDVTERLWGGYFQAGLFPSTRYSDWPDALELAFRVALVRPNPNAGNDGNQELTLAGNWFFTGHRNKLTVDVSWLSIDEPENNNAVEDWRLRVQWDLSL